MFKWVSALTPEIKIGNVDEEIIQNAKSAGLSEAGINAMVKGDKKIYKTELDILQTTGSIWACTTGYTLWFNAATPNEQNSDYWKIKRELDCLHR